MRRAAILLVAFAWVMLSQDRSSKVAEYPSPKVRESQEVVVNGVVERWQLEWTSEPKPVCEPSEISLTCPCTGFAFGEGGQLDLVRYREAKEIDRLPLTPLFDEQFADAGIVAIIQRWATQDDDFTASLRDGFPQSVAKRKTVQVMHFADYDHDGSATEFLLQIGTAPCGKQVCVAVGLSKTKPSLHAFGTAMAPDKPLYLQRRIWEQFRKSNGEIRAESWTCGDHGSEISTSVLLRATPQGIDGKWREYSCPPERRRLIKETPLSAPLY